MTNLEYMICESERCREIDLDTRNFMLNILYESENNNILNDIDTYSKKNYYNKIIAKAIHKMKNDVSNPNIGEEYIKEELDKYKHLIDECEKLKETAPVKISMKETIKQAHKAGMKGVVAGAGASLAGSAVGLNSDMKKAVTAGAVVASASSSNIKKTKASYQDDIKRLTANMNNLKSKYPKQLNGFKNSFVYKRLKNKMAKQQAVKEYVDDIRMEIYERELTGEITVEEREELLNYLDDSIM